MDTEWIAVDWGTSQLRVWIMSSDNQVLHKASSDQGMSSLNRDQYESTLLDLVQDWLPDERATPVLVCGMAGSREGWKQAHYLPTPIKLPQQLSMVQVDIEDPRISVQIVPGIKQTSQANVMRGEETQINGFLVQHSDYSGVLVLPGTHTKWVELMSGSLTQFSTAMTGELYEIMSRYSILRYSVATSEWHQQSFDDAFKHAIEYPEGTATRLFELRADSLLNGRSPEQTNASLSAELIAMEFNAIREIFLPQDVKQIDIIGNSHLSKLYLRALELSGYSASAHSGEDLVLAGLGAVFDLLRPSLKLQEKIQCGN